MDLSPGESTSSARAIAYTELYKDNIRKTQKAKCYPQVMGGYLRSGPSPVEKRISVR